MFRDSDLLVRIEGAVALLPSGPEWSELALPSGLAHEVGSLAGERLHAAELAAEAALPDGWQLLGLRKLFGLLDEDAWRQAARAVQIVAWVRAHRFCGRCAEPLPPPAAGTREKICPRCGLHHFPRIAPAIIVLVRRGDEILLGRSPHFAPGVYSTLAGFVEPGESLEEAVAREVHEEVGVTLRNVRYFGSQPWPFPHSLMVGFTADYAGGELRLDPAEIEDARWFTVDDLPRLPTRQSIARALIDSFLEGRKAG
ncbi:MAG TPA: NAD(+) diphosphatase [Thermoanaerobaculia bacterium]